MRSKVLKIKILECIMKILACNKIKKYGFLLVASMSMSKFLNPRSLLGIPNLSFIFLQRLCLHCETVIFMHILEVKIIITLHFIINIYI